MSLNEQLAVEVCGMEKTDEGFFAPDNKHRCPDYLRDDNWNESPYLDIDIWNPTADLNQFRMCYEALNESQRRRYYRLQIGEDVESVLVAPEQHAELILKAKGVS